MPGLILSFINAESEATRLYLAKKILVTKLAKKWLRGVPSVILKLSFYRMFGFVKVGFKERFWGEFGNFESR